jgi:hypothetical protein
MHGVNSTNRHAHNHSPKRVCILRITRGSLFFNRTGWRIKPEPDQTGAGFMRAREVIAFRMVGGLPGRKKNKKSASAAGLCQISCPARTHARERVRSATSFVSLFVASLLVVRFLFIFF